MVVLRSAPVMAMGAVVCLLGTFIWQERNDRTHEARSATELLQVADNNTPDGTETQDPEQQEQQAENQQLCGNANGCG